MVVTRPYSAPIEFPLFSFFMTLFRPCIDLHQGQVKQIVGGSLTDDAAQLQTNFASNQPAAYFADLYQRDGLQGGHVIQLGPGNRRAAQEALATYPGGLQLGGGVSLENAEEWLSSGASHVIITSWLFSPEGAFLEGRAAALAERVGKPRIVIDLSCRRTASGWTVAMNRWQTLTDLILSKACLERLSTYCDEFLVHAADVEGKCEGIDAELVAFLGAHCPIPVTYAGGVSRFEDLAAVQQLSHGRVDLTIGSALDVFGGKRVRYQDCVRWNCRSAAG